MKSGYGIALASGVAWGASNLINGLALTMAPFADASQWLLAPLVAAALYDGLRGFWQLLQIAVTRRWSDLAPVLRGRRGTLAAVAAAVAGGPLATGCFFLSIAFAGVTYGVAISSVSPALGALLARVFLHDRLSGRGWAGLGCIVAGAVVVTYAPPDADARHFYLGVGFALLTALGWSLEALFAKRAMAHVSAAAVNAVRQLGSFVVFVTVLLPALGGLSFFVTAATSSTVLVLLAAALVGSAGYLLYFVSVDRIGPGRAMPVNLTYVLWTAILGLLVLHEPFTWRLVIGAVGIVVGGWIMVGYEQTPRAAAADLAPVDMP